MPTRVITIPTSTRIRRPVVLAVMPTLAAASRNPANVIASPTKPIVSSSLFLRRWLSLRVLQWLGLQEERNRGHEPDQEKQKQQKTAIGEQRASQACESHKKHEHRQSLRRVRSH